MADPKTLKQTGGLNNKNRYPKSIKNRLGGRLRVVRRRRAYEIGGQERDLGGGRAAGSYLCWLFWHFRARLVPRLRPSFHTSVNNHQLDHILTAMARRAREILLGGMLGATTFLVADIKCQTSLWRDGKTL